jgi:hypothetical protein
MSFHNSNATQLQGLDVSNTVPTNGQVLAWEAASTSWKPGSVAGTGTVTAVSSANSDISVANGTSTPTLTLNSGTGANQIVKLDGSSRLPAVDGSQLTGISSGGISTVVVSGTSQSAAVNTRYITNNAGLVTVTLPATAAVGSVLQITGLGAGGWKVAQNAGQQMIIGNATTTSGTGGSANSTHQNDTLTLVCAVANTTFIAESVIGEVPTI